jgi:type 1 fimbriae regulatory protein FimB
MIKYLTKQEIKALLKAIKRPRDRAIFTIAYWRGLRASEVGMLRVTSFEIAAGRLKVDRLKNSHSGSYLLNRDEVKALRTWLRVYPKKGTKNAPLFPSNRHHGISRQQLDKLMRAYAAEAGIPGEKRHFHVLKHSIACHLREAGVDVLDIKDWLGHRSINSTLQYLHVISPHRDELSQRVFAQW